MAESSTPGYNVLVKINDINVNSGQYQFDYKTGVLEFVSNAVSPNTTDKVTVTGYRYVGQTLDQFITGDSGGRNTRWFTQEKFNLMIVVHLEEILDSYLKKQQG